MLLGVSRQLRPCDHAAHVPAARADGQWLPRLQFIDKVVDIPVMLQRQVRWCELNRRP